MTTDSVDTLIKLAYALISHLIGKIGLIYDVIGTVILFCMFRRRTKYKAQAQKGTTFHDSIHEMHQSKMKKICKQCKMISLCTVLRVEYSRYI